MPKDSADRFRLIGAVRLIDLSAVDCVL